MLSRRKISLARGIHFCPNSFLFLLSDQNLHMVENMYMYTYTRI
jgi:hypothetical protein